MVQKIWYIPHAYFRSDVHVFKRLFLEEKVTDKGDRRNVGQKSLPEVY